MRDPLLYERVLFVMDTIGLGVFTVVGIRVACAHMEAPSAFLLVFVGVITGVGGGVLRDVLTDSTPRIFLKHVYASASLAGALVWAALYRLAGEVPAAVCGIGVVVIIRTLSAYFRWNLPRAEE